MQSTIVATRVTKPIARAPKPNSSATSPSTRTERPFTATRGDVFHRVGDVMESHSVLMEATSPAALRHRLRFNTLETPQVQQYSCHIDTGNNAPITGVILYSLIPDVSRRSTLSGHYRYNTTGMFITEIMRVSNDVCCAVIDL